MDICADNLKVRYSKLELWDFGRSLHSPYLRKDSIPGGDQVFIYGLGKKKNQKKSGIPPSIPCQYRIKVFKLRFLADFSNLFDKSNLRYILAIILGTYIGRYIVYQSYQTNLRKEKIKRKTTLKSIPKPFFII
uniref:Uncharacterized protein n=1 Tax=Cacopsylla melanoneura TaxID=428564 RepID=A0A8D9FE50_9HEMI